MTALGTGVLAPIATAVAAAAWKLLGKNEWVADDYLLAFELLIAAVCTQLSWLVANLVEAAAPGPARDELWQEISARCGMLLIVGLVILPLFALGLRHHTRYQTLTEAVAFRVSAWALCVLVVVFLLNFFLAATV